MDQSIISAAAGLTGSLLGGMSTFAASWLTTRAQHRTQTVVQRAQHLEKLYAKFIREASRHLVSAWGHQMQEPEALAGIYSLLERIRLTSSAPVVSAAENLMRQVVAAYAEPNRSYEELQRVVTTGHIASPLTKFSACCRVELRGLGEKFPTREPSVSGAEID